MNIKSSESLLFWMYVGPPLKGGNGANALRLVQEGLAAVDLNLFQVVEGVKRPIRHAFIGQGPEPFAGLQFGRVVWQKDQMESFRDDQLGAAMPTRPIKHEDDCLLAPAPTACAK
jgi:hypothetical protein